MKTTISSTALVRNLGDCLARVKYCGEHFSITKNEEPVAELLPVESLRRGKWGELASALQGLPVDLSFANDLMRVNSADREPENPWA
jgi:antitoxin (DNA-binding transcriptional repressor) of toxin-antitoxin stability system